MKIKLIALGLLLLGVHFTGYAQLKGTVYYDQPQNGKKKIKKGLENVVVSDGYHVVRTDHKGNFVLPGWEKQRFVTVYPNGEFDPQQRFLPIEPTTSTYDFAVTAKKKKEAVNFVHISDTETYEHGEWVDNLKKYVKVHQPDFVVHTGDICYKAGMEWHANHLTEKELGVPIYYCLGNHDLIPGDYGEQFFEGKFGPAWYAFEAGNSLYVVTPMMHGDFAPGFNYEDIGGWLQNLLAAYGKDIPKIFFNHDLLTNGDSFVFHKNKQESIVLDDYNLKAWLYGHFHINMTKTHGKSGVKSYCTAPLDMGGIDHSPSSFRTINVDGEGNTQTDLIWTYLNKEIQIVSPQQNEIYPNQAGQAEISVNVYDSGSAVDSVRYSIWGKGGYSWEAGLDTSAWKSMTQKSDWNWRATFEPAEENLTLVIDAYFKSGEVQHRKTNFTVKRWQPGEKSKTEWGNLGGNKEHVAQVSAPQDPNYTLAWTANIGANIYMGSPVIQDNFVLTASFDDANAEKCFISCRDAQTGTELWRYKTKNGIKNQMVIAQNKVIATDMLGYTYGIDIATGKLVWESDLGFNRLPGFISGLVTNGEVVYTGFGESLSALCVKDGTALWRNNSWKGGEGSTPTMTLADEVLIASSHWGAIYAHNRHTGELLWSRSDDGLRFRDGVLTYQDGSLWVAQQEKLFQLDLRSGETIHSFPTGMQHVGTSAPIILEDRVIVPGSHPGIASFDRKTGKQHWLFQVDPALFYSPPYYKDQQQSIESTPILVAENLIFGAMDGNVYVLDAQTGGLLWRTKLGAPVMTSAAVSDQGFYICDFAGNIYFFKAG